MGEGQKMQCNYTQLSRFEVLKISTGSLLFDFFSLYFFSPQFTPSVSFYFSSSTQAAAAE